ncbi:hypothetical protein HDU85_004128 [Gaertneriomyces sp. JEL0708]|nr:hypothetical protein HDU85_004128 [Gaertneriomyces sp. JEL0708]
MPTKKKKSSLNKKVKKQQSDQATDGTTTEDVITEFIQDDVQAADDNGSEKAPTRPKKCPHLKQGTRLTRVGRLLPTTLQSPHCTTCKKNANALKSQQKNHGVSASDSTITENPTSLWACLYCGLINCGRQDSSHAVKHAISCGKICASAPVSMQDEQEIQVWCYSCDDEVVWDKERGSNQLVGEVERMMQDSLKKAGRGPKPVLPVQSLVTPQPSPRQSRENSITKSKEILKAPGLANLGNTCFFNSVMQCMAYTRPLRRHFLSSASSDPEMYNDSPVTAALQWYYKQMDMAATQNAKAINPKQLFGILSSEWGVYRRMAQQDSHELLRRLLGKVQTEEWDRAKASKLAIEAQGQDEEATHNGVASHSSTAASDLSSSPTHSLPDTKSAQSKRAKTFVESVFGGCLSQIIVCTECRNISCSYEDFMDLSLPLPQKSRNPLLPSGLRRSSKGTSSEPEHGTGSPETVAELTDSVDQLAVDGSPTDTKDERLIKLLTRSTHSESNRKTDGLTVQQCLDEFMKVEVLDGDAKFKCEECYKRQYPQFAVTTGQPVLKEGGESAPCDDDVSGDEPGLQPGGEAEPPVEAPPVAKPPAIYTRALKRYLLQPSTLPPILVLQLKRFTATFFGTRKMDEYVEFGEEIDLSNYLAPETLEKQPNTSAVDVSQRSTKYRVYGIVVHSGGLLSGHYVAYVRVPKALVSDDKASDALTADEDSEHASWIYASDTHVRASTWEEVKKQKAYLVFYEKIE